jgi:hypothetical protein
MRTSQHRALRAATALALAIVGVSCRTTQTPLAGASGARWTAGHQFDHFLVIVLENRDYDEVVNDPYMKTLEQRGVLLTNFHGIAHPSYPNYLAMIGGQTFGAQGDRQRNIDGKMIADLLEPKGLTWAQYAEDYPGNCFTGNSSGLYARKHVPFMSFISVQKNPIRCANVLNASKFDRRHLPAYTFFTPNMKDDGHDAETPYAMHWLQGFLDPILADTAVMRTTLIEVTYDENDHYSEKTNRIFTVLLGGMLRPGTTSNQALDHYSVLRTVEANFDLGTLANEASYSPIVGIWPSDSAQTAAGVASQPAAPSTK